MLLSRLEGAPARHFFSDALPLLSLGSADFLRRGKLNTQLILADRCIYNRATSSRNLTPKYWVFVRKGSAGKRRQKVTVAFGCETSECNRVGHQGVLGRSAGQRRGSHLGPVANFYMAQHGPNVTLTCFNLTLPGNIDDLCIYNMVDGHLGRQIPMSQFLEQRLMQRPWLYRLNLVLWCWEDG
jgi:hypothetical protein